MASSQTSLQFTQLTNFKGCDRFTNWPGQHFEAIIPSLSTWINGAVQTSGINVKLPEKTKGNV